MYNKLFDLHGHVMENNLYNNFWNKKQLFKENMLMLKFEIPVLLYS